jgi:membrane associated rhomboid family serine protease
MVFLPLYDDNPRHRIPFQYVTVGLIVVTVLVFLVQTSMTGREARELVVGMGVIPAVITGDRVLPLEFYVVPAWATLVTSAFLHGGFLHLAGNMLYLWIFGDNIEDAMGHLRFLAFYLLCAVAGGLAQVAVDPESVVPVIGASGAISGVLGAYLLLHPRRKVYVLIVFRTVPLPVWMVLGAWILFQIGSVTILLDEGSNTAFLAHIGGFVAGLLLIIPMRHKSVPLFGRGRKTGPWS